ncbi:MAG TPA: winged helix-turn-helix domain-containing protein, partial [Holophaga sp.]|nr:winged helix-turn-helix domain-containing protein [Holophaga sp.]
MSDDPLSRTHCYRFDGFEFRERTGELKRDEEERHLPDQAGTVLLALLRARGNLVSREEMRQLLWPDKVSGDFEGGLHAAVWKLRRALDDDGSEPRLVGTLPRRGYRLLVPVAVADEQVPVEAPVPAPDAAGPGTGARKGHPAWAAGAVVALACVAALLGRPWSKGQRTLVLPGGVQLAMTYLPPGEFAMGYDSGFRAAEPVHRVTLTRGFWLGRTEVTQAQWRAVMGNTPSFFQG